MRFFQLDTETEFTCKSIYENMIAETVDSDFKLACFYQSQARRLEDKLFHTPERSNVFNVN